MQFETKPISELLALNPKRPGSGSLINSAFAELPPDLGIFVPRGNTKTLRNRSTSTRQTLQNHFPERIINSAFDREKDGVWFWWTPKS